MSPSEIFLIKYYLFCYSNVFFFAFFSLFSAFFSLGVLRASFLADFFLSWPLLMICSLLLKIKRRIPYLLIIPLVATGRVFLRPLQVWVNPRERGYVIKSKPKIGRGFAPCPAGRWWCLRQRRWPPCRSRQRRRVGWGKGGLRWGLWGGGGLMWFLPADLTLVKL